MALSLARSKPAMDSSLLIVVLIAAAAAVAAAQPAAPPPSAAPLSPSQSKTLLRLARILENPPALSSLTPQTDFCSLPPTPSLTITCAAGRLTALSIAGDPTAPPLSPSFSTDSLITTLSRFPNLTVVSLVSLGLWGPLPSKLHRLPSLQSLDLTGNHLNGSLPILSPLGDTLTSLTLKGNAFHSAIPDSLASFDSLEKLDLSDNRFAGRVPPFLFALPALQRLDLSGNNLTGALPGNLKCGEGLQFVDISRNFLVGSLPECVSRNSSDFTVMSSWNCFLTTDSEHQHSSSYCNQGALAAVLPPVVAERKVSRSRTGLILGIVFGVLGGAVLIGLLLFFLVLRKGKDGVTDGAAPQKKVSAGKSPAATTKPESPFDTRHMSPGVRMGTLELLPYHVFTMEELEEATNGFDQANLIAEGPKGQFYKGWVLDGSSAIIRCMKLKIKYSPQCLNQYMDAISKLRHCHIVSILGHCVDVDEDTNTLDTVYLVYEYVSNGTLRSHLTEWRKREMLKWPQRIAAVVGVARGIQFLHNVTLPGIAGNDLNIDYIMLDETLTAKISNYKLPVLPKNKNYKIGSESPFSTMEDCTPGSIPNSQHPEKEDVYQLGLILLEVITGKPAESKSGLDKLKLQLQKNLNEDPVKLRQMTDPTIRGTFAHDSLRTAVEIALNCVADDPKTRPSIDDILWNLQYSIQVQNGWASSGSISC